VLHLTASCSRIRLISAMVSGLPETRWHLVRTLRARPAEHDAIRGIGHRQLAVALPALENAMGAERVALHTEGALLVIDRGNHGI